MYHPWRQFRGLSSWDVVWSELPGDLLAVTQFRSRQVVVDPRLLQAQRRSTIAHELVHIERGPTLAQGWWEAREERIVDDVASRRLISMHALGEALAWSQCLAEVAEELWVDEAMVRARLEALTEGERAYLAERLNA